MEETVGSAGDPALPLDCPGRPANLPSLWGLYLVAMRFRAETYQIETDELVADLGHWESRRNAQAACMVHALELLTWEQPWAGIWQASTNVYWYKVAASLDSN